MRRQMTRLHLGPDCFVLGLWFLKQQIDQQIPINPSVTSLWYSVPQQLSYAITTYSFFFFGLLHFSLIVLTVFGIYMTIGFSIILTNLPLAVQLFPSFCSYCISTCKKVYGKKSTNIVYFIIKLNFDQLELIYMQITVHSKVSNFIMSNHYC